MFFPMDLSYRGSSNIKWKAGLAFIAFGLFFVAAGVVVPACAQTAIAPGGALRTDKVGLPTAINQPPDANAQLEEREQQVKPQDFAVANAERKRQIAADSAELLKLATDLKAEVDKATKDTLSLAVIRKADEIERLARSVKEKMKLTAGGN
jgi:hypothetical protein